MSGPPRRWRGFQATCIVRSASTGALLHTIFPLTGANWDNLGGGIISAPSAVKGTYAVSSQPPLPPGTNVAPQATISASSENAGTGQLAIKAVDGVVDGYPGDYTREWATVHGGTGSWLNLSWATPQTVSEIVLYDRPNANDQITQATIQLSDGTMGIIGPLNNDGTATAFAFAPVTTTSLQLNITGVSSTTQNIGLAEIQVYATTAPPPPSDPRHRRPARTVGGPDNHPVSSPNRINQHNEEGARL